MQGEEKLFSKSFSSPRKNLFIKSNIIQVEVAAGEEDSVHVAGAGGAGDGDGDLVWSVGRGEIDGGDVVADANLDSVAIVMRSPYTT